MQMHNPPHPGKVLRDLWLEPMGMSVTAAAEHLGVSRKALSLLLNGHTGVSPEMATRLSIALKMDAIVWLNMQATYDGWQAEQQRKKLKETVRVMKPCAPSKLASKTG